MKIGILHIATGRYICFWDEFYKSAKEHLFKGHDVKYFVFTDSDSIEHENNPDVIKIYAKSSPWPISVCDKYATLLSGKEQYKDLDYIFHFNANMKFVAPIGEEILPQKEHGFLAVCEWANYIYRKDVENFPYDRNPQCSAYIPSGEGEHYLMGGLHGGRVNEYIEMCEVLNKNTCEDFEKGIIAKFHDESHINHYFLDKNPLIVTPNYIMPQNWKIKGYRNNIKGILLKKHHYKYGGHAYLRGITDKKITPLKYWLNKLFKLNLQ